MQIIKSISSLRLAIKKIQLPNMKIGFVPTMGALHEGHLSLMRKACRECDVLVISIFVNPMQFGVGEDFLNYPKQRARDELFAKQEKVDILFYPSVGEMYPSDCLTYVNNEGVMRGLCDRFRPGHFRGVTTVVAKLLNIVTPDTLYLGQKDAQQAVVLRQMVKDLNFPVRVTICPTVREKDGLAMSSRNQYLNKAQRAQAPILFQSLHNAKHDVLSGKNGVKKVISVIRNMIEESSSAKIQYVECVDADSLKPLKRFEGNVMIAIAARFGKIRLIDNIKFIKK